VWGCEGDCHLQSFALRDCYRNYKKTTIRRVYGQQLDLTALPNSIYSHLPPWGLWQHPGEDLELVLHGKSIINDSYAEFWKTGAIATAALKFWLQVLATSFYMLCPTLGTNSWSSRIGSNLVHQACPNVLLHHLCWWHFCNDFPRSIFLKSIMMSANDNVL
jgi:hypothetical protein